MQICFPLSLYWLMNLSCSGMFSKFLSASLYPAHTLLSLEVFPEGALLTSILGLHRTVGFGAWLQEISSATGPSNTWLNAIFLFKYFLCIDYSPN